MNYSPPQGSPSMDDYQPSMNPVDEGSGVDDHQQKHGSRRRQNQQLQHSQKTNHPDKQSKHEQQQQQLQSEIPPSNPGNHQNTNNLSLQPKVSDSSLSGYQSEPVVQIQAAPQKNLPKLDSKSSSKTQKEERVIPSSPKYPAKTSNLGNYHPSTSNSSNDSGLPAYQKPQVTVPSQELQPKTYDSSIPNEQAAPIQAPLQQNRPGKSPCNTKQEKTPKGDEDPPQNYNPTPLPQGKQKPASEEIDQKVEQKENSQYSQQERLPVPDGYPPYKSPTSPSKLEPPKVPPSKCCCDCCDCCSSCSIL